MSKTPLREPVFLLVFPRIHMSLTPATPSSPTPAFHRRCCYRPPPPVFSIITLHKSHVHFFLFTFTTLLPPVSTKLHRHPSSLTFAIEISSCSSTTRRLRLCTIPVGEARCQRYSCTIPALRQLHSALHLALAPDTPARRNSCFPLQN